MSISSLINRIYISLYICWLPIQLLVLKVEGLGFIPIILCFMTLLVNIILNQKTLQRILCNKYMFIWLALVVYMFINWEAKCLIPFESYSKRLSFIATSFFMPTTLIVSFLSELRKNYSTAFKLLFYSLIIYCLLGVVNLTAGQEELEGRMVVEGIGNDLPLHAFLLFCVSLYMKRKELLSNKYLIAIALLVLIIITASVTRKTFGACAIVSIGYILYNNRKEGINIKSLLLLIAFFVAFVLVFEYSSLYDRISSGSEGYEDIKLVDNSFLNSMLIKATGDRALQYSLCFDIIPNYLFTGIGLRNFMPITGFIRPLHTEYMVQLCENGLIGFTLLILFYFVICKNLYEKIRHGDTESRYLLFLIISILFLNMTTWNYDSHIAMIIYSFCIYKLKLSGSQL